MNSTHPPATSVVVDPAAVAGTDAAGEITHLFRLRSGVRGVLALGVAASVAANVLHAQPSVVGRAIAAWSPLALLLTVELISRVPVHHRALTAVRMTATAGIAGIAAWVSYWHMVSVVARNGEGPTSAHLLPLSVDGLVVVASVSLVEITARLRQASTPVTSPVLATAETDEDETPAGQSPKTADEASGFDDGDQGTGPVPAPRPARRSARPARGVGKASTATTVVRLRTRHPNWTLGQIAERAGVSERTVRRHLNSQPIAHAEPAKPTAAHAAVVAEPDTESVDADLAA
jgi:hypothetical protein